MNLLLDTNVLLWWFADSPRLGGEAREMIVASPLVYVSVASTWEIEIKRALGKLKAPSDLEEALAANQFLPLPISVKHSIVAAKLPRHHDDPFDRMLLAQANAEKLALVTGDQRLTQYEANVRLV